MPPAQLPFTKRCAIAAIATSDPDDAWFNERCLTAPSGRSARLEVFASHAWVYASCDLDDDEAILASWGLLSAKERDYLLDKCKHPLARAGDGAMASAVRYLKHVRPPSAGSAPRTAASGGSAAPPESAGTPAPEDAAAEYGASLAGSDLADRASASKVQRLFPGLSPAGHTALLAAGGGPPPPSPAAAAFAAAAGGADVVASSSVLHNELAITYGQAADRMGLALLGLFDTTGLQDWAKSERSDYRSKSRDVMINSDAAKEHGWHIRPPFTILEVLTLAPPAGCSEEDESGRLGARLARVAKYKTSNGDPRAYRSTDTTALAQDLAIWRDYCTVLVYNPMAAASRVESLLNILRGFFLDRTEALRALFPALGLGALIPCVEQQFADLCALLLHQQARVNAALSGGEADRAATSNTEWMDFLKPFFNVVLGAGVSKTTTARVAAATAAASAAAFGGGAPPPPTLGLFAPAAYAAPLYHLPPTYAPPYAAAPPAHLLPPPKATATPAAPAAGAPPGAAAAGPAAAQPGKPLRPDPTHIPCTAEIASDA
jgi:hypothetical protein